LRAQIIFPEAAIVRLVPLAGCVMRSSLLFLSFFIIFELLVPLGQTNLFRFLTYDLKLVSFIDLKIIS